MNYYYVAYTKEKKLVKGKVSADNEQAATSLLDYGGYRVVSLKSLTPAFDIGKILKFSFTPPVQKRELVIFSRQLALLIESGIDIIRALELLQMQMSNRVLQEVITTVIDDVRDGKSLSAALSKHTKIFPKMYYRAMAAGEQGGNLGIILRQMADFMERSSEASKKLKSAMTYPVIVLVVAVLVIGVLVTFVLPAFTGGAEQLWRIEQLPDGAWRIMPKAVPNSKEALALSAIGSSFATLAKFDPKSDKQRWLLKTP